MRIEVDGEVYTGNAVADDGTTLILDETTEEFVKAVYSGRKARITTVQDTFDMALPDATAALDDVVSYRKTSSRWSRPRYARCLARMANLAAVKPKLPREIQIRFRQDLREA